MSTQSRTSAHRCTRRRCSRRTQRAQKQEQLPKLSPEHFKLAIAKILQITQTKLHGQPGTKSSSSETTWFCNGTQKFAFGNSDASIANFNPNRANAHNNAYAYGMTTRNCACQRPFSSACLSLYVSVCFMYILTGQLPCLISLDLLRAVSGTAERFSLISQPAEPSVQFILRFCKLYL